MILLRLSPWRRLRAARVSEISEATAASATAPEERINFHIGNPVQDPRLTAAYLRAVLGLDIRDEQLTPDRKPGHPRSIGMGGAGRTGAGFSRPLDSEELAVHAAGRIFTVEPGIPSSKRSANGC